MSYKDKTFCASPDCKNACGRMMSEGDKQFIKAINGNSWYPVSYGYFCGKLQKKGIKHD